MVHQAVAIMYCTQQVIQGENLCDRLKNHKSFPFKSFAVYGRTSILVSVPVISQIEIECIGGG